jgi:hypothetical protein
LITEKNDHHSIPPFEWFKPCQKSFHQQEQLCNCHEVMKQPKKSLVREFGYMPIQYYQWMKMCTYYFTGACCPIIHQQLSQDVDKYMRNTIVDLKQFYCH